MTETRTWVGPSAPERLNILRNTRTSAIVGMSDKISRTSPQSTPHARPHDSEPR